MIDFVILQFFLWYNKIKEILNFYFIIVAILRLVISVLATSVVDLGSVTPAKQRILGEAIGKSPGLIYSSSQIHLDQCKTCFAEKPIVI